MFSKWILFLSLMLGVSSCDFNLRAKAPESSLKVKGMNCLSDIGPMVSAYVDDKLSEGEINDFFGCVQKSFIMFENYTRGSKQDEYLPEEIRGFLQTYFVKDRKISDQLLTEFMLVKKTLVGGSADSIRRSDLHAAVNILETLKQEALRMKPHLRVLNIYLIDQEPKEDLAERMAVAQKKLHESIEVLVEVLAKAQQPYSVQNFENIIEELRKFVKWQEHFPNSRPLSLWMGFFRDFKDLTVSPSDRISAQEWAPLLTAGANWYMMFLEIKTLWSWSRIWEPEQLEQMHSSMMKALRWAKEAIANQPRKPRQEKYLEFEAIAKLYGSAEKMGWVTSQWPLAAVDKVFRAFVTKILGETQLPSKQRRERGLKVIHISRLEQELTQWFDGQTQIENEAPINNNFFPQRLLYVPDINGIFLAENIVHEPLDRFNETVYHALRSIAQMVIKGYAARPDLGLTEDELQSVYLDIRDLMVAWKLADPRNCGTGKRSFIEGNLFTYNANGNEYLETKELMQLLAFLKSGGQLGKQMYDRALARCPSPALDVYSLTSVNRTCLEYFLATELPQWIPNLPGQKKFLEQLSFDQRIEFANIVLETIKTKASRDDVNESGDINSFMAILQYQEAVFTRFNTDLDKIISNKEADEAYKVFGGLIKRMGKMIGTDLSDSRAKQVFEYILRHQEMPPNTFGTKWDFFWGVEDGDPITVDRMSLARVFRVIIQKVTESQNDPHPEQVKLQCQ